MLERDNQPGSYAAIKTVTVISLDDVEPAAWGEELPTGREDGSRSTCCRRCRRASGWISDKAEGLAVTADGRVFAVTDNDGVSDASGETLLLDLGSKAAAF